MRDITISIGMDFVFNRRSSTLWLWVNLLSSQLTTENLLTISDLYSCYNTSLLLRIIPYSLHNTIWSFAWLRWCTSRLDILREQVDLSGFYKRTIFKNHYLMRKLTPAWEDKATTRKTGKIDRHFRSILVKIDRVRSNLINFDRKRRSVLA